MTAGRPEGRAWRHSIRSEEHGTTSARRAEGAPPGRRHERTARPVTADPSAQRQSRRRTACEGWAMRARGQPDRGARSPQTRGQIPVEQRPGATAERHERIITRADLRTSRRRADRSATARPTKGAVGGPQDPLRATKWAVSNDPREKPHSPRHDGLSRRRDYSTHADSREPNREARETKLGTQPAEQQIEPPITTKQPPQNNARRPQNGVARRPPTTQETTTRLGESARRPAASARAPPHRKHCPRGTADGHAKVPVGRREERKWSPPAPVGVATKTRCQH